MESYLVAKPIKVIEMENKKYVVSMPDDLAKLEVDDYILKFLELIGEKECLKVSEVDEHIRNMSVENQEQYLIAFRKFIDERLLIPFK
ncbi:hypothetical protein [Velocimicrobium porci]|uniref:Uncharacterized protein n=1 Tax=Velocimicrobium porci TaxID=2606634 RepID=A0A6L5XYJ3_9FIRM|nr:hypothetical protein [Velocimicrobium porci]MSS63832.1 hypothetical protein [Velocimicrobium porci]